MMNRRAWQGIAAAAASGRRPDGWHPSVERGDNSETVNNNRRTQETDRTREI
jgi:hypothetical protein